VDLFDPGSGSQVHDNNGGILASGFFWTLPVDDDALRVSHNGRRAVLDVDDLQVVDSFQFFGANQTPATVSMHVEWRATGLFVERGEGDAVAPTDPAAFLGRFAVARSTAAFTGSEFGFSFRSDPGVSTDQGWAEIGRERNGTFLQ
jgi:hypothetical protein